MGALQSPRELEGREKTHFVFFCRFPDYFGQERYVAMSGIVEHADGELEDVPAATDATPSVSTGNVSRLRKKTRLLIHTR